jgi:hypothetical protein
MCGLRWIWRIILVVHPWRKGWETLAYTIHFFEHSPKKYAKPVHQVP